MLVAGEASGDLHGGNLARALLQRRPELRLFGMGGERMRAAGVETVVDNAAVAVVGIWEVVTHLREIKAAFDRLSHLLAERRPELLVLIDYPDFNLRLAAVARARGVPVVYYVSPQIWAWRRGRVDKMRRLVRRMLVIFPFEEDFYRRSGIDCSYVGHPLLDEPSETRSRGEIAAIHGLDPSRPVVGILPGSRRREIALNLPVMVRAFQELRRLLPSLQAVLPVADTLRREDLAALLPPDEEVALVAQDTTGALALLDAAMVASGTATLQVALQGVPMAIVYRLSPVTYLLGRLLVRIPHIGLPNIVAGREVVPELIQGRATPEAIAGVIFRFLTDEGARREIQEGLSQIRRLLGGPGASGRAADRILDLLP